MFSQDHRSFDQQSCCDAYDYVLASELHAQLQQPSILYRPFLQPLGLHDPPLGFDNNQDALLKTPKIHADFHRSQQKQPAMRAQHALFLLSIYCRLAAVFFAIQSRILQLYSRLPPPHAFLPRVWRL